MTGPPHPPYSEVARRPPPFADDDRQQRRWNCDYYVICRLCSVGIVDGSRGPAVVCTTVGDHMGPKKHRCGLGGPKGLSLVICDMERNRLAIGI